MPPMRRILPLLTTVLVLGINSALMACPMCKDSIPNSDAASTGGVPVGFNYSVYTLLVGFLAVLGFSTMVIVKGIAATPRGFPVEPKKPRE
jgi:hypothetical protein